MVTPVFWYNVFKRHGSRGLLISLLVAIIISGLIWVFLYPLGFHETIGDIGRLLLYIVGVVIFIVFYWAYMVKKSPK